MKKLFSFVCVMLLVFTGCEDNKKRSLPEKESQEKVEKDTVSENKKKTKSTKKEYPKLTQENVISFLTEYGDNNPETKVLFSTTFGDIEIELFEDTPLHRANLIYLIKQKYFDETTVHRVVPDFIIQIGNSDIKSTQTMRAKLGKNYLLPAEIIPGRGHFEGTISGAKQYRKNPDKQTVPYEFFIFLGEKRNATHLDGDYTVFGKVTKGMDVVKKISELDADGEEWPLQNVYIKAEVLD